MPTWPTTLPCQPILDALSFGREDNVDRFQPDHGDTIDAKRFTAAPMVFQFEMHLTNAQMLELDDFHGNECNDGATRFDFKDPAFLVTYRFKFRSPPQFSRTAAGHFRAQLQLSRLAT